MKNRRFRSDIIMHIINGISIISWMILGVIIIILLRENSSFTGISEAILRLKSEYLWTTTAINRLLVLLVILSISAIFLNLLRIKRRGDKIRFTPVFSGILAAAALVLLNI